MGTWVIEMERNAFTWCDECDMSFKKSSLLKKHKKRTHAANKLAVKCEECREAFPSLVLLKNHCQKKHQLSVAKESRPLVKCKVCNEGFPTLSKLNSHTYKSHQEKKHGTKEVDVNSVKSERERDVTSSTRAPFSGLKLEHVEAESTQILFTQEPPVPLNGAPSQRRDGDEESEGACDRSEP